LVVSETLLNPEPVAKSDACGESKSGKNGDGVGRGEKEEI
jgi:hypothetical protein